MPIIIMDNTQLPEEKPVKGKDARRTTSERGCSVVNYNFEHSVESYSHNLKKTNGGKE